MGISPFDDDCGSFFALVNEGATQPVARLRRCCRRLLGDPRESERDACLDYIEQNWPGIRPMTPSAKLAEADKYIV